MASKGGGEHAAHSSGRNGPRAGATVTPDDSHLSDEALREMLRLNQCACGPAGTPAAKKRVVKLATQRSHGASFVCCMLVIIVPSGAVLAATDVDGFARGYLTVALLVCSAGLLAYLGFLARRWRSGRLTQPQQGRRAGESARDYALRQSGAEALDQSTWLHVDYHDPKSIPASEMSLHPCYVCSLCTRRLTQRCGLCTMTPSSSLAPRGDAHAPAATPCSMVTARCGHAFHFHCVAVDLDGQLAAAAGGPERLRCPIDRSPWRFRASAHQRRWEREAPARARWPRLPQPGERPAGGSVADDASSVTFHGPPGQAIVV